MYKRAHYAKYANMDKINFNYSIKYIGLFIYLQFF